MIWRRGITVSDFYSALGVDIENVSGGWRDRRRHNVG